ncbi:Uncharacterized protein OBRU01_11317 [Operophtera brumata]|uniref:MPN domain-containing protein n=1 Tax=Operophtera brumata TaxID=104452 RepID=A0A0L7LC42_OPEBR|nr:Uncharacterized protein OBRU01_11317 [Operophtera brumata]
MFVQILRVQSAEGTARVEALAADCTAVLFERVHAALALSSFAFALHKDRQRREEVVSSKSRTLRDYGLKHGDLLFLSPVSNTPLSDPTMPGTSKGSAASTPQAAQPTPDAPQEDDVDLELSKMSGNIERQRDEKLCRHNSKGCCCQPGAVTLTRQPYRHVDNVLVEHPAIVERFLAYWRATGEQRIGYLYGTHERHPDVPLGIRARVAAIYEPAQACGRDAVALQTDSTEAALRHVTSRLGLRRLGWLFTDLLPKDGQVEHIRGVDTHFLSAQECIMAGNFQNLHPNACRHATSGYFGSKFVTFVTVYVSGEFINFQNLHPNAYRHATSGYFGSKFVTVCVSGEFINFQNLHPNACRHATSGYFGSKLVTVCVSGEFINFQNLHPNACRHATLGYFGSKFVTAMVRDSVLLPTRDAPELAYVRDSTPQQYVPDVYYKVPATPSRVVPRTGGSAASHSVWTCGICTFHNTGDHDSCEMCAMPSLGRVAQRVDVRHLHLPQHGRPRLLRDVCHAQVTTTPPPLASAASHSVWTCGICTFHNTGDHDSCEMCAMPR